MQVFTNVIGSFVFEGDKIIDKILFKTIDDYKNKEKFEKKLKEKHPKAEIIFVNSEAPAVFKDKEYFEAFREFNLELTKEKIKNSVNEDNLICQAINSIKETDKAINILVKRLREWHSLYLPELSEAVSNNEKFAELSIERKKEELIDELKVKQTMGADLKEADLKAINSLADRVFSLFRFREETAKYLEKVMEKYCPNLKEVAGATIGAKLIEHTGSLKRLVMMPASTLQILGAEKALFRHIKSGARPPKHGLIHEHQFLQNAKKNEIGKKSRALADKLSIAVKVDFFKGEFIGKKLKKELEEKFK